MNKIFFLFLFTHQLTAATYYVAKTGNNSNPGTLAEPWLTIDKANTTIAAGDTVYIRDGFYIDDPINPTAKGTVANPITYSNYAGETVVITNSTYGVYIEENNSIKVYGITVSYADQLLIMYSATNCIISNCVFTTMRYYGAWQGSRLSIHCQSNRIENCTFSTYGYMTSDDIGVVLYIGHEYNGTDLTRYNLIQNCNLMYGGHEVLGVYGMFNMFRSNNVHNEAWWNGLYGNRCILLGGSNETSGRNLFEWNRIGPGGVPPDNDNGSGFACASRYNIVRNNFMHHSTGPGIRLGYGNTYLSSPCTNKFYNNTIYRNGLIGTGSADSTAGIGISVWGFNRTILSNVFKNNIVYGNTNKAIGTSGSSALMGNQCFLGNWTNNFSDPGFAGPLEPIDPIMLQIPVFILTEDSPCIDAGVWLTIVTSVSGSGTTFTVNDSGYFCDGWGMISPDRIQLEGDSTVATIVSVDYTTHTIVVDSSLTWTNGQGVSLPYNGDAPDIGAIEYTPPTVPSGVTNTFHMNSVGGIKAVGTIRQ